MFRGLFLPQHGVVIALQEPDQVGSHCPSCYAGKRKQFGAETANKKEKATLG